MQASEFLSIPPPSLPAFFPVLSYFLFEYHLFLWIFIYSTYYNQLQLQILMLKLSYMWAMGAHLHWLLCPFATFLLVFGYFFAF